MSASYPEEPELQHSLQNKAVCSSPAYSGLCVSEMQFPRRCHTVYKSRMDFSWISLPKKGLSDSQLLVSGSWA